MGLIARENTAPIADTELGSANEMELEYSKIFSLLNGGLSDANFDASADLDGAKFADGSVPGVAFANLTLTLTQIAEDTLTTSNLSDTAATQYFESDRAPGTAMTSSSSFVDCDNIQEWNVTPASTSNYLFMTFTNDVSLASVTGVYGYGFSVNGVETSVLGAQEMTSNTARVIWAETAPAATGIIVKPIYKLLSGSETGATWGNRQFSAMLVPIKT